MSRASQVNTDVRGFLLELFPVADGWAELINPHDPGMNDDLTANKAWGYRIGPRRNTNRLVNCAITMRRDFDVIVVRKYHSGLIRTSNATALRVEIENLLCEDIEAIAKMFEKDPLVDESETIANIRIEGDGGIEFMRQDDEQFFMMRANGFLEYFNKF